MLAFVVTVNQVSAYAVAFFRGTMLLPHDVVLALVQLHTTSLKHNSHETAQELFQRHNRQCEREER